MTQSHTNLNLQRRQSNKSNGVVISQQKNKDKTKTTNLMKEAGKGRCQTRIPSFNLNRNRQIPMKQLPHESRQKPKKKGLCALICC